MTEEERGSAIRSENAVKRPASVDGRPRMYAGFVYVIRRPAESCVLASSGSYSTGSVGLVYVAALTMIYL